jgi:hypothetical protein
MKHEEGKRGRKPFNIELLVERGLIPSSWKEDIIQIGSEGKTKVHIMNHLNITRHTFYRLQERNTEFAEAVNKAAELSQQWWIEIARQEWLKGNSRSINSNHWSLMMRNLFGQDWSDRRDHNVDVVSGGEKITDTKTIQVEVIRPIVEKDE